MKIGKNGWGYRMMAILMGIIILALLVATYFIYKVYDNIPKQNLYINVREVVKL